MTLSAVASSSSSSSSSLLSLYRQTLRLASRFPSIKRDSILKDIKDEWRRGSKLEKGSEEAEGAVREAGVALSQLEKFVGAAREGDTSIDIG